MEQPARPSRACPECGSRNYEFRSRKKVQGQKGEETETKYRCKSCQHEWRVKTPE